MMLMPLVEVKPLADFPPGSVLEIETDQTSYAVCNVNGLVYCLDGVCPHASGPLGQGALHGNILVCPWHGWEFQVSSGISMEDEDCRLNSYPVVIQNHTVFVDLP
jgi:nitrite reductase/ring-hydroxylating ferredoxin subunit